VADIKVRVLFLYPYEPGSVASFVRPANIIRHLLDAGIQVTLATVAHRSRPPTDINLSLNEFAYLKPLRVVRLWAERGAFLRNALIVNRLLKSHDIVHFQKCHPVISLPAVLASVLTGRPVHYDWDDNESEILSKVVSEGGSGANQLCEFRLVERRLVSLVDTVSVASQRLRELARAYGAADEDIFDAPVGADLDTFAPRRLSEDEIAGLGLERPVVLYQGQLEHSSFAEEFVACAAKVRARVPNVSFVVVGGGVRLARLMDRAAALRVPVKFTGYISHRKVADYINAADVCVATFGADELTRCKSPLKIAEYLACGKPIVATEVGDVARMAGDAALYAKPGDTDALAGRVVELLRDEGLRLSLGRAARQRAEARFNWKMTTGQIIRAYKRAIARRAALTA